MVDAADEVQTTLYEITAEEWRDTVASRRAEWLAAQRAVAETSETHRAAKKAERVAYTRFVQATDGALQRELPVVDVPKPVVPQTVERMKTDRRQQVRDAAVKTLRGIGGAYANRDLASLLGQDPHGLSSLLEGDHRLEKFHQGRDQNEQTWWRLTTFHKESLS